MGTEEEHQQQQQNPGFVAAQPQAPPPYQEGAQAPPVVMVGVPQPTVILTTSPSIIFTEHSTAMTCPNCRASITTETYYESGLLTWLLVGLLILIGCWFGCCLIPMFMDGCKDVQHRCPNCKTYVGVYKRM